MVEYLLSDEKTISNIDFEERKKLINVFKNMPTEFFSKLRHFQPQIGCLNACSICSKYASNNMAYWTETRIRNIVSALKYSSPSIEPPLIVWDRESHRNGVIFSYLDNDVGNYEYLDKFIDITYRELGVKTRISTVGYSRHNKKLNKIHKKVAQKKERLAGVRLSLTPYEIGWASCNSKVFSREEYKYDIANFLKIYKKYYRQVGSGSRKFCIEIRYKPLVINSDVRIFKYKNKTIIYCDKYLYISKDKNINFLDTYIDDAKVHRLSLNNNGVAFERIEITRKIKTDEEIIKTVKVGRKIEEVRIFRVKNDDGYYYSVSPKLTDDGNYGINFYPITRNRKKSGYIILERFFLNTLFNYKKERGLKVNDNFYDAKWKNVDEVIEKLKQLANQYHNNYIEKSNYIENELLPLIETYAEALKIAKFKPSAFFDKNFTIDTGIICNLGRAIKEFKGLVSTENEPLTLNHERNYGKFNSTMIIESDAWRLSCGYNDEIIIEKMNLSKTATREGQIEFNKKIKLNKNDIVINYKNLKKDYLIPGQRKRYGNKIL